MQAGGEAPDRARARGRALAPYPIAVLAAASFMPFLGFANSNSGESFDMGRVLLYALSTAVLTLVIYLGIATAARRADPKRVAVAIAAFVVSFFAFSKWLAADPKPGIVNTQIIAWCLVTALTTLLAYRFARSDVFRKWVAATLVLVCVVNAAAYALAESQDPERAEADEAQDGAAATPDDLVRQPNVYAFLLDQYARNDTFAEVTSVDNAAFHDALREQDFEVTERSLSSYNKTTLSMMSMFEMGYPVTTPGDVEGDVSFDHYLVGDNNTVERFHQLGYQFIHAHGGPFAFARCTTQWADVCLPPNSEGGALDDLQLALLDLTPIGSLDLFDTPWNDPEHVLDTLETTAKEEPFFLFSHLISPHPPYRFDENCERRPSSVARSSLTTESDREAYANEVRCLNEQVLDVTDRIIADDPDAIILVFSDHGSDFLSPPRSADLESWNDGQLRERYGTQNALRLPEACRGDVESDTPNVHDFAIVFACLEGREPDLPDYRAFLRSSDGLDEIPVERLTDPDADGTG